MSIERDVPDPAVVSTQKNLRTWLRANPSPKESWVVMLVGALSATLAALHKNNLGYFRLSPDTVLVEGTDAEPSFSIENPEATIRVDQKELIPIAVDPWYAPPEAAGLLNHSPGENLLAWDWWSLGRLVQEVLLGKPLLHHLLKKEIARDSNESKEKAEALLMDRLEGTLHPGAVEQMPPINPRLERLLRGLLAAAPTARWNNVQVEAWLGGEMPRDHYAQPKHEPLFRLQGHNCTIAEAAEDLSTEKHWAMANEQLLHPETAGTLAAFLRNEPSLAHELRRLEDVLQLLKDESYDRLPAASVEEAIIILALQQLSEGKLIWRGHRMDAASLREQLQAETGKGDILSTVLALAAAPSIALMDHVDTEIARIIADTHKLVEKISDKAAARGWISKNDILGQTRLWILALEPPATIHRSLEQLHEAFATSTYQDIERLFRIEKPSNDEAVLLAWMAASPRRFGLITHEEWARRRLEELRQQGREVALNLYWINLQRALRSGPWWFGHMAWLIVGWSAALATVAIARPGPAMLVVASLPAVFALAIRFGMAARINQHLQTLRSDGERWRFADGPSRCLRERATSRFVLRTTQELHAMLLSINAEIAALKALHPPPTPIKPPPRLKLVWWSSIASWVVLISIFALCFREMRIHPPSWKQFQAAWSFGQPREQTEQSAAAKKILLPWPYKKPSEAKPVSPKEIFDCTTEQQKMAVSIGTQLTEQYARSSIDAPIVVRIPTYEFYGYMLFDARKQQTMNKKVYILSYAPIHRSWIELDGKIAIILSE